MLTPIVKDCTSYAQVIRKLGLKISGGSQAFVKDKVILFGIDTTHFKGQGWSKGLTIATSQSVKEQSNKIRLSPKTVLRKNTHYKGRTLRTAMLSVGIIYRCSECGRNPIWNGKPLKLHTDHINGNRRDNRRQNLRFLCPNCHQQTPTWGNGQV